MSIYELARKMHDVQTRAYQEERRKSVWVLDNIAPWEDQTQRYRDMMIRAASLLWEYMYD